MTELPSVFPNTTTPRRQDKSKSLDSLLEESPNGSDSSSSPGASSCSSEESASPSSKLSPIIIDLTSCVGFFHFSMTSNNDLIGSNFQNVLNCIEIQCGERSSLSEWLENSKTNQQCKRFYCFLDGSVECSRQNHEIENVPKDQSLPSHGRNMSKNSLSTQHETTSKSIS